MTMKYRILLCSLFCLCAVTVLRAERVAVSYTHLRAHET